jgi:hypothetical protein
MKEKSSISKIWSKSLFSGFLVGVLFLTIAPLGLAVSFIETLRPVLVPGLYLAQQLLGGGGGPMFFVIAMATNVLVFTAGFFLIFLIRNKRDDSKS